MNLDPAMKFIKKSIYNTLKVVDKKEFNSVINKYNHLSKRNTDFMNVIYEKNPNLNSEEHIEKSDRTYKKQKDDPKLIALYLPQFHTIPENDKWWGKGFTEWTNVTKAQPQFLGHYQPHLPDELGFYDLSNNDIFYKQIELAKKYGIYGFCFHYYWFSGKRLLEKPIFNYLNDKNLDFPFMLCWANEPWSRRWDGSENDILIPQSFEEKDYTKFIEDIMPFFKDERYIKIDNRPILIIYRPHYISKESLNDAIKVWKDHAKQNGFDGLYLINTRTGDFNAHPSEWGLNATAEFPPNDIVPVTQKNLNILNPSFKGHIYNLAKTIEKTESLPPADYPLYKTVFPSWDNTARKKNQATIFYNSSPELYKKWLYNCIIETKEKHPKKSQIVFINAWNEWAEGAHLEPDRKYGFAYLEATLDALEESRDNMYRYGLEDHYDPEDIEEETYDILEKKERKVRIKNPYLYLLLKSKGNIKQFLVHKRDYDSLKGSELFDESYYLKTYPNIQKSGMDPLLHYCLFGYKEGKLPSLSFDGNHYLNIYNDVKNRDLNPLAHYVIHGKKEGRIFKSNSEDYKFTKCSPETINNILSALNSEKISIICYINEFEDSENCIKSILKNTKINHELILIDDNNDGKIENLLNKFESIENLRIIHNPKKLGFFKSVNNVIKKSKGDVVLIKSNAIVTSHWLQKMVVAAYYNKKIGTVTPLSNHDKFLSDLTTQNSIIHQLKPEAIVSLVENASEHLKPEITYPNGICIYIKREVIQSIGLLHEGIKDPQKVKESFYLKISENGWKHIIDDSTYIYQNNGHYDKDNLKSEPKIEKILDNIKLISKNSDIATPKKRVLYVLHENVHGIAGGTGQTTKDILEKIDTRFECYILVSSEKEMVLWKRENDQTILIKSGKMRSKWSAEEFYNYEFKSIYFQVLVDLNIDIVHIQHLIGHTYDLPKVAKALGIPTIISFHDFYYICPTIHLLDHENHYCEGQCRAKNLQCKIPVDKIFEDLPVVTDFIDTWRKETLGLFDNCTVFTVPTKSTMDLYISIYPQLKDKECKIIEHGRDIKKTKNNFELPSKDKPIKVLIPGTIKYHKGHDFIKELKKIDRQNRIEFHFMGSVYDDLKEKGIYHGTYKREDFSKIVNKIKPSFIGIFSICPETYCHTLTEAWSCGVPVLATNIGALKERIEKNGGGWFLDHESPITAYNQIIQIAESIEEYLKVVEEVSEIKIKTKKEMTFEYEQIYWQYS